MLGECFIVHYMPRQRARKTNTGPPVLKACSNSQTLHSSARLSIPYNTTTLHAHVQIPQIRDLNQNGTRFEVQCTDSCSQHGRAHET